jgi:hypothetical protein
MVRVLLIGLVGCAGQPADQVGESTPSPPSQLSQTSGPGPTATSSSSSGLVWVDASGAEIAGVVSLPEGLGHMDIHGNVWKLTAWSGQVDSFGVLIPAFQDEGCTLDYFLPDPTKAPPLPRYVLRTDTDDRLLVIADDAEYETIDVAYLRDGPDCVPIDVPIGLSASAVSIVDPLAPSWTAPLHPELP